jgi:hypothetical protein
MTAHQLPSSESIVLQERIRQARWGFNLSVAFAGTSAIVTIAGLVLLLSKQISSSAYGAFAGGAASTAVGSRLIKLSSEANDRLDQMMKEQDDEAPKS